ncbi:cyclase family protein [Paenibacillus psychroresistens]|uniref:Kynurenine formamidase n=1 Tax=Paenibacillus psychroresistens TaxID=1778678 RepID=A0A6B8RDW3_9BACL|nr:cyclase family protein [Paenibacillus psychroresistens]QGQ94631.1 cyclase family protein [Paenibacillus psychroresistens]
MSKFYDISMTIQPTMQVYKNKDEKRPVFLNSSNFVTGKAYETIITMDAHTGTHIDAPLHMLENGATMEAIDLESLVGPARVLDLSHVVDGITKADLEPFAIQAGEWLLFKTSNSASEEFNFEFIYLKEDGAHYLHDLKVKGIGTDGLGIERAQPNYGTHRTLLGAGIHVVEGLRLKDVPGGNYFMVIAPLKLAGIEAAPARAFLIG